MGLIQMLLIGLDVQLVTFLSLSKNVNINCLKVNYWLELGYNKERYFKDTDDEENYRSKLNNIDFE